MSSEKPSPPPLEVRDTTVRIHASHANLKGSTFRDVDLSGLKIDDANMTGAVITDVTLLGARLVNIGLRNAVIEDALIEGLTINGISVTEAFSALAKLMAAADENKSEK